MTHTLKSSLMTTFYFLIAMVLLGGLIAFIQSGSYFQFLTPILFAFSCSPVVAFIIWRTSLHHLPVIIVLCILLAVGIYSVNIVASYLILKIDASDGLRSFNNFDEFLLDVTGKTGVLGYIDLAMEVGIQTQDTYNPVPRTEATGSGVLFYWGLDMLFITAGCLWGGWMAYRRPYAEACSEYFGFIPVSNDFNNVERIGTLQAEKLSHFIDQLKTNHFEEAGSVLSESGQHFVFMERSKTCKEAPMNILVTPAEIKNTTDRILHRQQVTRGEMKRFLTFTGVSKFESINPGELKWFTSTFGTLFIIQILVALALRFVDVL